MSIPYIRNRPTQQRANAPSKHHAMYGRKWKRLSLAFLRMYPFCVHCLCCGAANRGAIENPSELQRSLCVDHIVPHGGDVTLFYDQDNWQTLCVNPCHSSVKRRTEVAKQDWYAVLRERIAKHKTQDYVQQHAQWLPQHIREALLLHV